MNPYTVTSLFSGIGGMDLAFSQAGFKIVAQVEIDDYCRKVLAKHAQNYWPNATQFADVRQVGLANLPRADVIAGGFPCQDLSIAGKQAGIREGNRSGLWYEFRRIIGELRPRIVFIENVPAIIHNGGTLVVNHLAEMGYDCIWGVIPASAVGAGHERERWFLVGNATSAGLQRECGPQSALAKPAEYGGSSQGKLLKSTMGRVVDGLSRQLDSARFPVRPNEPQHEWEQPRTTDNRGANYANRVKALGNAVVPQVIYPFAVAIKELLDQDTLE